METAAVLRRLRELSEEIEQLRRQVERIKPEPWDARLHPDRRRRQAPYAWPDRRQSA